MIIGIDGNEANVPHHVGVSVYTHELLSRFAERADKEKTFIVFLRQKPNENMPPENDFFKYSVVPGKILWSQVFLPIALMKIKIDVFFAPAHYAPRLLRVPLVLTIHDLSYFYFPDEFLKKDLFKLRRWTEYSIRKAQSVISVSKTTKKDILKWYEIPDDKITVIYNGFRRREHGDDSVLTDLHLKKKKYLLFVGTLQPRKNLPALIQAFSQMKQQDEDYKLVIVGKKGWLFDSIFEEVSSRGLEQDVIFTGYETEERITGLYKHAACFILPSLYEGFGIPLLEAMSL